jgi:hypothetical protein
MSRKRPFENRRARAIVGGSVAAVALAAAGVLGGVGFAKSSATATQYQYGKITICHKTHSRKHPSVTITISRSARPAHQRHGDTLGACGSTTTTSTTTTTTTTSSAVSTGPGHSGGHGNPHGNGNGNGHSK